MRGRLLWVVSALTALGTCIVVGGCSVPPVQGKRSQPPVTGSANMVGAENSIQERPLVAMKLVDTRAGKPPLLRLLFDVTLRNDRAEPRWFLLPKAIW